MKTTLVFTFLLVSFILQAQDSKKEAPIKVSHTLLNVTAQPLLIVDGVKRPGLLGPNSKNLDLDMNPDNIKKIEVVKGKSATLLYGEEGKNGVILITTKKTKNKKSELPR